DVLSLPEVARAVAAAEARLADSGRVLLRPSGTEPVVRVMVEGRDRAVVDELANELAREVQKAARQAHAGTAA
ncbi:MAG: phosphoglucosamine mutase, partial [Gammaproteobacteria bacterium]|nr:phosphoglucosamine mutase [Gammaproteobacteria bacterium]